MGAERIASFYDAWSPVFLAAAGATFQSGLVKPSADASEDPARSTRLCAEAAGLRDGERVLDAGCGVGGPAEALLEGWPGLTLDAVTLSPVQVELARARLARFGDRARVHRADFHALPFPDASFDVVFYFEVTGYSPDPLALYHEARRVLRPGGRVYVKDVFRAEGAVGAEADAAMAAFDALWCCARTGTLAEAAEAATRAGFEVSTRVYPHVGVARFIGALLTAGGELSEFGVGFARTFAPIAFGELIGRRP